MQRPPRFHLIALACVASFGATAQTLPTLPTGLDVARGSATVSVQGSAMTVRNSAQAILNWQDFSIGRGASVHFAQPSAASSVLNRVTGQNPSQLFGSLTSNGQVWLLNPNGVLFGTQARVDVASLVTSTLRLNDADWLAGRWRFSAEPGDRGSIVNQGELRSAQGGRLLLVGGSVRNEGSLDAPGGQVLLAAGQSVELVDTATPNLSVRLRSGPGAVANLGSLRAAGGTVDIAAAIVNQQGLVSASEMVAGPGGTVRLVASDSLQLAAGSRTEADGSGAQGAGGQVLLDGGSAGAASVQGQVSAQGRGGQGGRFQLLGQHIGVLGDGSVDVSGSGGGGLMQLGGGLQGRDASVRNSETLVLGRRALLRADATDAGDGGRIILWSNQATRAYGSLSARGAGAGGHGGFVETSGGWLDARPARLDVTAPHGRAGQWLIDPYDILISDSASDQNVNESFGNYSPTGTPATINAGLIASLLSNGTSVTVDTASGAGTEPGTITLNNANIVASPISSSLGLLTLRADRDIVLIDSNVQASGGSMSVQLWAGRGGTGRISFSNSRIFSGGGDISLTGDLGSTLLGGGASQSVIDIGSGSALDAGSGRLTLWARHAGPANAGVAAVRVANSSLAADNIDVIGRGDAATSIIVSDAMLAAGRDLSLNGSSSSGDGVLLDGATQASVASSGGGGMWLIGSGVTGVRVEISGSASSANLTVNNGATMQLSGNATGPGTGLKLSSALGAQLFSNQGGSITLESNRDLSISGFAIDGGSAGVTVTGDTVTVTNSSLASDGSLQVGAGSLSLAGNSSLSGADVLVAGNGLTGPTGGFSNASSLASGAVVAGNRWRIWTTSPSAVTSGGLLHSFSRYSVSALTQVASDVGNGYAFSNSATASVSGTPQNKVYDATLNVLVSNLAAADATNGLTGTLQPGAALAFASKGAGANKPLVFNQADPFTFVDASNRPAYGVTVSPPSLTASISPAPLLVSGLLAQGKVYDATTVATIGGTPSVLPISGDSVSLGGTATGNFVSKNVGVGVAINGGGLSLGGVDAGNYTLTYPALSASITPATLSVTGLSVSPMVYNTGTNATSSLRGTATVTPLGSDSVFLGGSVNASFSDRNAGNNKTVSVTGLSLAGPDAGNYLLGSVSLLGDITPFPQPISGLFAGNKVYDGSSTAPLAGTPSFLPLPGDSVSVSGTASGSFADANAAPLKPVTVTGLSLTGPDAGNYSFSISNLQAGISPATLSVGGVTAANKVYDASTAVTLAGTARVTPLGGDIVSLTGTPSGSFASKNAGNALAVNWGGLTLAGSSAANYTLSYPTLRANITPATLAVSGLSVAPKVYDGGLAAALSGTAAVTPLGSDSLSLAGTPSASFSDRNAGNSKSVAVTGLSLTGTDARNYRLGVLTLLGSITPLSLSVSGLAASDKVYDRSTAAALMGTASVTPLAGDSVSLGGSAAGSFADRNVGAAKPVSVTGLSLAGADSGNYALTLPTLSASITAAPLSVSGVTAASKVYDGSVAANLSGTPSVSALAGDSVSLAGSASGSFASRNAGNGVAVNWSGLSLGGADGGNYTLVFPALSASITPATLSYVAAPASGTVGAPLPPLTGTVSGFVGGDTQASSTSGTLSFSSPATPASPAGSYPVNGEGLNAVNYRFVQDPANATALRLAGLPPVVQAESGATQAQAAVQPPTSAVQAAVVVAAVAPPISAPVAGVIDVVAPAPAPVAAPAPAPAPSTAPAPAPAPEPTPAAPSPVTTAAAPAPAPAATTQAFQPVKLEALSDAAKVEMLATRQGFKDQLFARATQQLERNPGLADLPPCVRIDEALAGRCLVTETLRRQQGAEAGRNVALAAPVMPVVPAAPAAPSSPGSPPATSAPIAAPAAPLVAEPPPAPALSERRRVRTAALPQIERKVALVVGVDRYNDPSIPALQNAVRDAEAMASLFENSLGYETLLLRNPDRVTVVAALNRLALVLRPQDSVVVYYAGHGDVVEATRQGYWQLADADSQRPETWLANADISRLVAALPAAQVALVSDSCYSGSLIAEERIRASTAPIDPIALLTRKTVVVMSSGGNEPVSDAGKNGHSPFAFSLMEQLRQVPDWRAGGQVFERVRFAVARELPQRPQYGAASSAGHQRGGDYLFEQRRLETR